MNQNLSESCTAFVGATCIASGDLQFVALKAKAIVDQDGVAQPIIFEDATSRVIEVDLRGSPEDVVERITKQTANDNQNSQPAPSGDDPRGPGRPRLGVVAREVTLLPRHWEWLASQPGGASVALRKLVEQARIANQSKDRQRRAQEAAYRFLSTMAGNEPYFEEAARALFAGNKERFDTIVSPWPIDIGEHAKKLAASAFEASGCAG